MYFCAQKIWPLPFPDKIGIVAVKSIALGTRAILSVKNQTHNVPRKSAGEKKVLRHEIKTRVNDQKFTELSNLLPKTRCKTMSELVRNILHNKPIKVYTVDESFPKLMEEISSIRKELNAIGININQVTRGFNNSTD